jgi:uncharacterized membrane protein YphA (DoxX/SURF4 family)
VLGARLAATFDPSWLIRGTGVVLLVGGVLLLVARWVRPAALALVMVLVPITLIAHVGKADPGPLLKNLALTGTLLVLTQQKEDR